MDNSDSNFSRDAIASALIEMLRNHRLTEIASTIEACADPLMMGSAFSSAVKALYHEHRDVPNMLAASQMGLAYCLKAADRASDRNTATILKRLGYAIAFNTAANCWPGWGDPGITIIQGDLASGLEIATQCLTLAEELALTPRELGGAHWLIGALELAAGRFGFAQIAFKKAEQTYLNGGVTLPYILMTRGYFALAEKFNPHGRHTISRRGTG